MRKKLIILLFAIIAAGLWRVFQDNLQPSDERSSNQVIKITSEEVDSLIQDENTFVLDVHIPEQIHIASTDAFIPYNDLESNVGKLPTDKNTPILVYCRSGSMSNAASKELLKMGYTKVYDLVGGINEYRESHAGVILSPEEIDLGNVLYEEGADAQFTITNNTSSPLKIQKVSGSCSCTQPTTEKSELDPYESTVINIHFEPSIHKDDSDVGDLVRLVFIDTDNENFEHLSFKIIANVIKKEDN